MARTFRTPIYLDLSIPPRHRGTIQVFHRVFTAESRLARLDGTRTKPLEDALPSRLRLSCGSSSGVSQTNVFATAADTSPDQGGDLPADTRSPSNRTALSSPRAPAAQQRAAARCSRTRSNSRPSPRCAIVSRGGARSNSRHRGALRAPGSTEGAQLFQANRRSIWKPIDPAGYARLRQAMMDGPARQIVLV